MTYEDYEEVNNYELDEARKQEDAMAEFEKEQERKHHDLHNRTITMESRDSVWAWRKLIEDHGVDGKLSVEEWGRDCDQVEATSLREIDATLDALATLVDNVQEYAEGPWSLTVMTQEEVANWQRYERDHGAEQMNY